MTTTTSIVVDFQERLEVLLGEAVGDPSIVRQSWPHSEEPAEGFLIGEATGLSEVPSMKAGRRHRDEVFTQKVLAHARRPGQTATDAKRRAVELKDALDGLLADDPVLSLNGNGLPGLLWAEMGEWSLMCDAHGTEGYQAWCEIDIDCKARLI